MQTENLSFSVCLRRNKRKFSVYKRTKRTKCSKRTCSSMVKTTVVTVEWCYNFRPAWHDRLVVLRLNRVKLNTGCLEAAPICHARAQNRHSELYILYSVCTFTICTSGAPDASAFSRIFLSGFPFSRLLPDFYIIRADTTIWKLLVHESFIVLCVQADHKRWAPKEQKS